MLLRITFDENHPKYDDEHGEMFSSPNGTFTASSHVLKFIKNIKP